MINGPLPFFGPTLGGVLNFDNVANSLLAKEIRQNPMEGNEQDATLNVDRGRKLLGHAMSLEVIRT